MNTTQPELFDLEAQERARIAETPWAGAPLTYTTDYYSPADLEAATERYRAQHGEFGCIPRSHMWFRSGTNPPLVIEGHELHVFNADGRCDIDEHTHAAGELPGASMTQAICPRCTWHHIGNDAVIAWHDHAMPGWRDLPSYDHNVDRSSRRSLAALERWARATYPPAWQFPGAPVRTQRQPHGTRAVPGYSPWGGYDIANIG